MPEIIDHPGIVKNIKDRQTLIISIISTSACNHCSSKVACTLALSSEAKEKEVEVFVEDSSKYRPGESVVVQMKLSAGNVAVMLSYIVPLIVMLVTVFVTYGITKKEAVSGLLGLIVLVPYYFLLYLLHSRLKKRFQFTLKD